VPEVLRAEGMRRAAPREDRTDPKKWIDLIASDAYVSLDRKGLLSLGLTREKDLLSNVRISLGFS
jgi:hypothetical protein